jgi:tripartite-type tricarboxylate transporter receptor subunit TctC
MAGARVSPVRAQAKNWPAYPVKMIVGASAGGSADYLARILADYMSRTLGQPLVVDNRPGAATNRASETVANASPDGYTLLLGGSFSHSINPYLFTNLPYDPEKSFAPIAKLTDGGGELIVVPASLPVRTLQEFIDWARRDGPKVNYASSGLGSPGHVEGAYLNKILGLQMTHVPYKGASEAVGALLAGIVQMTITAPTAVLPMMQAGRIRALACTTVERSRFAPDVPGSAEAGLRNFDLQGWYGAFAPAHTDPAISAKLHDAFSSALVDPLTRARLFKAGLLAAKPISIDAYSAFIQDQLHIWGPVVKASGAHLG